MTSVISEINADITLEPYIKTALNRYHAAVLEEKRGWWSRGTDRFRQSLTGHVKPKGKRIGLVKLSALVSGTWKEFEPRTGVTAPPYVQGGSGETLAW